MSFDYYDIDDFTEAKKEAGVPSIICDKKDNENEYDIRDYTKATNNEIDIEKGAKDYIRHKIDNHEVEITKIISGLNNNTEIKNKVIKKILLNSLDKMIANYMQKEALPSEFVKVSKQKNGLEILIKYFFKNNGGYILTKELIDEINIFLNDIYENDKLDIVYERVGKIQKFIHQKIDDKYGYGAHLNLDTKKMKNILSASRLHLNIFDIKNYNMNTLIQLIEESKKNSFKAYMSSNKFYYPMWKARGMKSLIYFLEPYIQDKIYNIYYLDKGLNTKIFKNKILEIYLRISSIHTIKVYNQLTESEWILLNMEKNEWQEQV